MSVLLTEGPNLQLGGLPTVLLYSQTSTKWKETEILLEHFFKVEQVKKHEFKKKINQ
jgi:hypothetical protein